MSNRFHTSGPWVVTDSCAVVAQSGMMIADPVGRSFDAPDEFASNAVLIAAAPDLLDALERVVDIMRSGGKYTEADVIAVAAIKRVRGEA